jgi:nucleotide-binding universal stress UspA family protein
VNAPRVVAVGFDGSADAACALRWAATLALATGADVRAVHAVGLLEHAGLAVAAHEDSARRVAVESGLPSERFAWEARDGDPCSVLRRAAEGPGAADLLVVGTRGAGAHPGALLGSTSLELAEHAPVPVVIVPRDV